MRSFVGSVLATLLVLTTPVGAGQGVHQGELLHPILPHLHFINGRLVMHDAGGATETVVQTGPALGAGVFGDAAGLGSAISPTVPRPAILLPIYSFTRLGVLRTVLPREFLEIPPDPPPQTA
jgi:hypothetical protein